MLCVPEKREGLLKPENGVSPLVEQVGYLFEGVAPQGAQVMSQLVVCSAV